MAAKWRKRSKKRKLDAMAADLEDFLGPQTKKTKLATSSDSGDSDDGKEPTKGKITGLIKKWYSDNNYGFIIRDDHDGPELFFHRKEVRTEGGEDLKVGFKVEFKVRTRDKGDYATEVKVLGFPDPKDSDDAKEPTKGKITGRVVRWQHDEGFGSVKRDDTGYTVYCHQKQCAFSQRQRELLGKHCGLKLGAKVEFFVAPGPGPKDFAFEVTAIGGGHCASGRSAKGTVTEWKNRGRSGKKKQRRGVILGDDGQTLYVQSLNVWEPEETLNRGDRVEYDLKWSSVADGRPEAWFVTLEGNHCFRCAKCGGKGHECE